MKDNCKVNTPIAVNTRKLVVTFSKNFIEEDNLAGNLQLFKDSLKKELKLKDLKE